MGSRSTTLVKNENGPLVCLYRQYDGYWEGGHGEALHEWLSKVTMTQGSRHADTNDDVYCNGIDELAAKLVTHFKACHMSGNVYLTDLDNEEADHYEVEVTRHSVIKLTYKSCGDEPITAPLSEFVAIMRLKGYDDD